jgi:hypothetical protein
MRSSSSSSSTVVASLTLDGACGLVSWLLSAAAAQLRFNVPIQRHPIATPANMPGVLLNQT